MPSRLNAPVLTLDAAKMHQVDPRNVESLFGMWTVFNKCSQNIKDGSRLENLSWRLWARETLCCPPQPDKSIVPAIDVPAARTSQVPSLSNSPSSSDESGSEGEEEEISQEKRRRSPSLADEDSALSKSRGKEPHLTPTTLKKIVVQIQEKSELGPLSPSIKASISSLPAEAEKPTDEETESKPLQNSTDSCISGTTITTTSTSATRKSDHRSSDTSVSSDGLIRSGSVVHGFSPVSTSFRAKAMSGLPVPSSKLAVSPAQKPGMFQLGVSSEDDESSFENRPSALKPPPARSSLSHSLNRQQIAGRLQKKTTSFRDIVEQRRMDSDAEADEGAIATDSEDGDSVFDEEENDDWEDSPSDDDKTPAQDPPTFRRVESRPDLVSRPSMLSMQLDQRRRTSGLQNEASRSSPAFRRSRAASPNGPSLPRSPEDHDEDGGLMMRGSDPKPQPRPMPIAMPQPPNQTLAHSPRTTRRNMLSTELTESLRKNLLWERQQKSQTVNAFLKRNRNAQSMANLQGAVKQPPLAPKQPEHRSNNSWNQEFDNPWEFNAKGW
ncbi:uncharacterized protein HMPREF1541_05343 [Cyphellophora europaea CBS 101466]|uniref:Uncharacterized protein n=1 Tax=Cyphellophora europaea (strain CBS 101466) TaxID=1220924 RepID=W2RS31_CYPE1|nr:uncharacterized protein HMPREF1541_05343 [Cyphellophora europaea CBS 101466]ETN39120.1 hypothetical protein HMPREF1541_05343 [Cyphellophora europaea CBS 101466]